MTRDRFVALFNKALDLARELAKKPDGQLPARPERFLVYAPKSPHNPVSEQEALDLIYIDCNSFYKIIDVAIIHTDPETVAFVRVSGHSPVIFARTFDPGNLGPFKTLAPMNCVS